MKSHLWLPKLSKFSGEHIPGPRKLACHLWRIGPHLIYVASYALFDACEKFCLNPDQISGRQGTRDCTLAVSKSASSLCTCHRLPRGGNPGLMWGNMGTLWGLCNKFLPLWWGKCGDLDIWMPYSRGECGDFASVQLRGDWERSTVRSIDGKMAEDKFRTAYKLLRIEKVYFF